MDHIQAYSIKCYTVGVDINEIRNLGERLGCNRQDLPLVELENDVRLPCCTLNRRATLVDYHGHKQKNL